MNREINREEVETNLVKIETDLVNEETEELPVEENEQILKESAADEGCHKVEEQKVNQSEFVEIETGLINPVIDQQTAANVITDLVRFEAKQTFAVNREALKETMLKTWSKKGGETESPSEKETTCVELREPSNFQNLIHKDLIQRTLYKDKREALMERQDRTKTSGSKRHWACKVCFLF